VKKLVLTVKVAEAAIRETGDGNDPAGENTVNVLLVWPRPGKAEVLGTTGPLRLKDHLRKSDKPDRPAAFDAPVLKERVEGETALLVQVLDEDRSGVFARFLRSVGSIAVEGVTATLGSSLPGILRQAFGEAAEQGALLVRGPKDTERLEVIAVSRKPVLISERLLTRLASSGEAKLVRVALDAPRQLMRKREKGRLAPGRPNGHLVLELRVREA
jgi:hypothetical protein